MNLFASEIYCRTFGPKNGFGLVMLSEKDECIKTDILNEAQKLFRHFGLTKTTMEDIAKAAGKGKSTLYYYYRSKDQIFDEVVMREMEALFKLTKEAVNAADTAEEKLKAFSVTKFKHLQEKANLYKVVRGDLEHNFRCILDLKHRYDTREISLLRNILKHGMDKGEIKHYALAELDAIAFVLVCAIRGLEVGLFVENKLPESEFDNLESRMDMINDILMRGLKS
ncbi:TetR/AcrR family transcriptional regulator [Pontibacter chitinilyticus]|uniref:TetR/AcrR family transcriptional regulator n=1 Tax=Pontibacter chitinilyticus TaxID=2674989 RepID=UPI00321B27A1